MTTSNVKSHSRSTKGKGNTTVKRHTRKKPKHQEYLGKGRYFNEGGAGSTHGIDKVRSRTNVIARNVPKKYGNGFGDDLPNLLEAQGINIKDFEKMGRVKKSRVLLKLAKENPTLAIDTPSYSSSNPYGYLRSSNGRGDKYAKKTGKHIHKVGYTSTKIGKK